MDADLETHEAVDKKTKATESRFANSITSFLVILDVSFVMVFKKFHLRPGTDETPPA